jgi:3-keto-5-aminohexanoate cleavage enzyme
MSDKPAVWLEAAVNGPWSRERQPQIPVTEDDIVAQAIACAHEGAAIIHFHPYDPVTGRQRDAYEIYAPVIERIRSKVDVICYGTLPFTGDVDATAPMTAEQRFAAVDKLARSGLLEWSVVDPGSTHISTRAALPSGHEGFIYANPESHIRHGLELCRHYGLHPSFATYEPAFMRLGSALARCYPGVPQPVYRLMFSDTLTFGFPPRTWAIDAYLALLAEEDPSAPWMVAGLGAEVAPLIKEIVNRGGHVRVGLEDVPMGHKAGNLAQVRDAHARIDAAGGRAATAAEIRQALKAVRLHA